MSKSRKTFSFILIAAVIMIAVNLSSNLAVIGDDEAQYIVLAKSLAAGEGYRDTYLPGSPFQSRVVPAVPFLLIPFVFISGGSLVVLKFLPAACAVISILIMYRMLKDYDKGHHHEAILAAVAIFAFNPHVLYFSNHIMTELPFVLISLLAILLFDRYDSSDPGVKRYLWFTLAIVVTSASFYFRNIGAALFVAFFLYSILKRNYRDAVIFAVLFGVLILPWIYHDMLVLGKSSFPEFIRQSFASPHQDSGASPHPFFYRIPYYGVAYATVHLADLFIYPFLLHASPGHVLFPFKLFIGAMLFLTIIYGYFRRILHGVRPYHIYVIVYGIIISLFYIRGERYLVPLLPFLAYFLMAGLRAFESVRILPVVVTLLLVLSLSCDVYMIYREKTNPYNPSESSFVMCADWIKENSPEGSVVLSRKPRFLYLRSGRRSVWYPYTEDTGVFDKVIRDKGVDYIIDDTLSRESREYLRPYIRKNRETLDPVFITPSPVNTIYRIKYNEEQ